MSTTIYSKTSPYYTTTFSGFYLDVINFRNIPNIANDVQFTVTSQYANRPDLLAYDLYGDSSLWWVFAVRNKDTIKDPIYDLYAGQVIYLPQPATIQAVLGS
jgi:hypothetical protein